MEKTKQAHANLCGAKTRSGKPCRNPAMQNGRCRMHGGKSTGAPKRNANAVKTGEHETIWLDALEEDEQKLFDKVNVEEVKQTDNEIRLTDIRLRRMLNRIKALQEENLSLTELKKGIDKGQETNLELYQDNLSKIQAIEEALTRIQGHKRQLIETKAKLTSGSTTTKEDNVADMMEGILDAVDTETSSSI